MPIWFSTIGTWLAYVGAIGALGYYVFSFVKDKIDIGQTDEQIAQSAAQIKIEADQLVVAKESFYLEKIQNLQLEVDFLNKKVAEVEKKMMARDQEMVRIESLRVSALIRVNTLEQENNQLKDKVAKLEGRI